MSGSEADLMGGAVSEVKALDGGSCSAAASLSSDCNPCILELSCTLRLSEHSA